MHSKDWLLTAGWTALVRVGEGTEFLLFASKVRPVWRLTSVLSSGYWVLVLGVRLKS